MATEYKKVLVNAELMERLARTAHNLEKAKADYADAEALVFATVHENETVTLHSERNGVQATYTVRRLFDKADMTPEDAAEVAKYEAAIKAIKAKYPNTKVSRSIGNIR